MGLNFSKTLLLNVCALGTVSLSHGQLLYRTILLLWPAPQYWQIKITSFDALTLQAKPIVASALAEEFSPVLQLSFLSIALFFRRDFSYKISFQTLSYFSTTNLLQLWVKGGTSSKLNILEKVVCGLKY